MHIPRRLAQGLPVDLCIIGLDCLRDVRILVHMLTEAQIAALITQLAAARGWKLTHASRMASGSGDTLSRIEGGIGLTIRRANAIISRCSELWPENAPWPSDIQRPDKSKGAA